MSAPHCRFWDGGDLMDGAYRACVQPRGLSMELGHRLWNLPSLLLLLQGWLRIQVELRSFYVGLIQSAVGTSANA